MYLTQELLTWGPVNLVLNLLVSLLTFWVQPLYVASDQNHFPTPAWSFGLS
jgi:hypothetical protein